jgi:hypothetical protein
MFDYASGQPFADQAQQATVRDPVLEEPHHPVVVDGVEERADVGIEHPVHPAPAETDPERVQRLMLIAPGSEPVGEAEKVRLIDGVQHRDHRLLDDLVLQRSDAQRTLPAVPFGDIDPS